MVPDYLRDPAEIYRRSFALVEQEARFGALNPGQRTIATRLIHACGMTDIAETLVFSSSAVASGVAALQGGCAIFTDVEMVRSGIIQARLPAANPRICTLGDDGVAAHAAKIGNTRSAAAVDLWDDQLKGAIVAIGNAPTALFRLLERVDEGAPCPALILGFAVGFVGAAESKAELIAAPRGCELIALPGRRGGSALAAAAVNALAGLASNE